MYCRGVYVVQIPFTDGVVMWAAMAEDQQVDFLGRHFESAGIKVADLRSL